MRASSNLSGNTAWSRAIDAQTKKPVDFAGLSGFLPGIDARSPYGTNSLLTFNPDATKPLPDRLFQDQWVAVPAGATPELPFSTVQGKQIILRAMRPGLSAALRSDLVPLLEGVLHRDRLVIPSLRARGFLELGAGLGRLHTLVPELGGHTIETDTSSAVADYHKTNPISGRRFELVQSNQLPYADNSVDVVVGLSYLCCAQDPVALLKEVRRVLKPNGVAWYTQDTEPHQKNFVFRLQVPGTLLFPCYYPDASGHGLIRDGFFTVRQQELASKMERDDAAVLVEVSEHVANGFPHTLEQVRVCQNIQARIEAAGCTLQRFTSAAYIVDLLSDAAAQAGFGALDAKWGWGESQTVPSTFNSLGFGGGRGPNIGRIQDSMGIHRVDTTEKPRDSVDLVSRPLIIQLRKDVLVVE